MNTGLNLSNYKITLGTHREQNVIFFEFPNNEKLKSELKACLKVKWSSTQKKWYALDMPQYRKILSISLRPEAEDLIESIPSANKDAFIRMREQIVLKGYSPHTQRSYLSEFAQFLHLLGSHRADTMSEDRIRSYVLYCKEKLKLKENTIHSRINALKFYYEQVLHRKLVFVDIPRPKKPSSLPKVISKEDIRKMLEKTDNIKHRMALKLVYGMGLRVSEIVQLKLSDYDQSRKVFHIRNAKGKKDRYIPAPQSILEELNTYYLEYRPKEYILEGQAGGQYTIRSVQAVFKQAMIRAKINKPIGIHGLRHSYATHLMEAGVDIAFIQKLLGHKDIKTTLIYTKVSDKHLSKIKSPLDHLWCEG